MNKLFSKIAALSVGLAMAIGVGVAVGSNGVKEAKAADHSCTVTMATEATAKSWANGVAYTSWVESTAGIFTFTATGGGNNGKYYTSDSSWRMYNGGSATISCSSSYEIVSVSSSASATWTVSTDKHSATASFNATVKFTTVTIEYDDAGQSSTMIVKNSSGNQSPFAMNYGPSGQLFYAYESDGSTQITSGITWTVSDSDILVLDSDFADNHCWVKPGTKVGEATLTAVKSGYNTVVSTITVTPGDLDELVLTGSMTKTSYKVGDSWSPAGFAVSANYTTGYTKDVTSEVEWSYNPTTASSTSISSVIATASYGGESASSSAQSVTVVEGVTYDLTKIDGFSSWGTSYGTHDLTEASFNPVVGTAATLNFSITNKQGTGIGSTYPCIGAKTNSEVECLKFTLNASDKKITTIDIVFVVRYTNTYPSLHLHKGSGISTEEISNLTMSGNQGNELTLSYDNLNDTVFTVGYNAHQTGSNGAVGIKSISIGLAEQAAYGTTHHIKVTSFPRTVYHVGEKYDSTGLAVTAYDGADEATANFKDVTAQTGTGFTSGIYTFDDDDVPTVNMWVEYTEDSTVYAADDIVMHVYALAEYELVSSEPADWSGQYLIVGTNTDSELAAMNGGLVNPDVEHGYSVVTDTDGVIEAGQELEWTIAPVTGGYSIQGKSGKYIGSLTTKSNGMLVDENALVNTLSISGSDVSITGTNTYKLSYNETGDRFRYYASGSIKLYKLKQSSAADEFAQTFLGAFACDASGENKPTFTIKEGETYWSWNLLSTAYSGLTPAEKEQFRLGVASESGSNIEQALARYDYIVGKYFVTGLDVSFTDFMERNPDPVSSGAIARFDNLANNNTAIIVIVIAATSALAFTTLLVFKKKRQK